MSDDELKESVSAFVDGEPAAMLSDAEIVDALVAQPVLREQWHRYHLIGDAMRSREHENHAPSRPPAPARAPLPSASPSAPRERWLSPRNLAMAASACAVAVLGGWWAGAHSGLAPDGPVRDVAVVRQIQRLAMPASPHYGLTFNHANWNVPGPEIEARLNGYLVNHNAYLSRGMHGMLPYARVVAYDVGR